MGQCRKIREDLERLKEQEVNIMHDASVCVESDNQEWQSVSHSYD